MIEYKKVRVRAQDCVLDELLRLSKLWANENCCSAYYENDATEYINHDVYLAI